MSTSWERIGDSGAGAPPPHPAPATAPATITPSPCGAPRRAKTSIWIVIAAVAAGLTPIAIGASHALASRALERSEAAMKTSLDEVRTEVRAQEVSSWVHAKSTVYDCQASNTEISCTFTNVLDQPVTTCVEGRLVQKKASGVSLRSLVLCTGRIAPRSTKSLSAPWTGGFAKDMCNAKTQFGNEILDWDACTFTAAPVDLPALEKEAARRAPALAAAATGSAAP